MLKLLISITLLICLTLYSYSQPTNIYQPNGTTTNFGKIAADSLNYYVVNYPALSLMKIDGNNNATQITTLTADPFQTMIWNNGKGIYPVTNGAPFKLFNGTTAVDVTGGQLPMAGYTGDKTIITDYFHIGKETYFRTNDKIYKTDYSSDSGITTLSGRIDPGIFGGILEMQHTTHSIIYSEGSPNGGYLRRIDLATGTVTTIDSAGPFEFGTVYNDEYYYCSSNVSMSPGNSKVYKVSDNGTKSILYTEIATNKYLQKIIGVTPKGVIAIIATTGIGREYVCISGGIVSPLNWNTLANSLPCAFQGVGSSRTTSSLVYFETLDTLYTVNSNNKALWVTDGTLAGTKKIFGGTPANFSIGNLSPWLHGSAAHCGNDLYYKGTKGTGVDRLIFINGSTFAVQAFDFTVSPTIPSIYKVASGIEMIGLPFPTSSAEKAVFKINCSSASSIKETVTNQEIFELFPNPGTGKITINLPDFTGVSKIVVYNISGEQLYSATITESSSIHNLNLQSGLYLVTVNTGNHYTTRKIIIE